MLEDCKCRERRNNEIKLQFEARLDRVMDFMKCIKDFYENCALSQETVGKALSTIGNPTRSFLAVVQSSPLFEKEQDLFTERFPQDFNDPFTYIKFCNIRAKFQKNGQRMINASTTVR